MGHALGKYADIVEKKLLILSNLEKLLGGRHIIEGYGKMRSGVLVLQAPFKILVRRIEIKAVAFEVEGAKEGMPWI
jgi:hypothetical protein